MKFTNIAIILFIASLILFIPPYRQETEFNLQPFQAKSVVINIQNTNLIIESNIVEVIQLEIYYLDPEDKNQREISIGLLAGIEEINIDNRGFYLINFLSQDIATITITTEGVPDTSFFIVSLTLILAIGSQIQKQFSRSFDY